jgi:PAS domain S-box-containing protein
MKRSPRRGETSDSGHGRLVLTLIALATLATIAAVLWYYLRQRNAIEAATAEELAAISKTKADQIINWRQERIGDGHVLASEPIMQIARRMMSRKSINTSDRNNLRDVIQNMAQSFLYTAAALVDPDGNVRFEWTSGRRTSPGPWKAGLVTAQGGKVALSELYRDPGSGRALMALAVPIPGQGALILEIDAERFVYPYLESWPTASRTGETYVVRVEGRDLLYISDPRQARGSALIRRRPMSELRVASRAAPGSLVTGKDYRGVPVMIVLRPIPDSQWILVTKIDQEEVYAPLRRLTWELIFIVGLIALSNAAGVGLVWRNKQLRAHREKEDWFRRVANDTPAYLWMSSATKGENTFINSSLAQFLGTSGEALERVWTEHLHPDDAERARKNYSDCFSGRREYSDEFRIRRRDGEYRWMVNQGVPRFSAKGDFLGYAGALMDITERNAAEHRLWAANAELARELEERTRTEKEIQALSDRLIHAQEEERSRVARELHDDLSQQIAAVSIAMSNLKRGIPEEDAVARSQAERMQQRLAQLAESARRISHELHPAVLKHLGLAPALRAYCAEFTASTGVQVSLITSGSFDGTSPSAALCLYRIAQEALKNIARHARVGEASVELSRSSSVMRLVVADKGDGMELGRTGGAAGLGLVSMRERARLQRGRVEILSKPGEGTRVTVEIPESSPTEGPGSL